MELARCRASLSQGGDWTKAGLSKRSLACLGETTGRTHRGFAAVTWVWDEEALGTDVGVLSFCGACLS